jgi:hypothetical protein
VERRWAEGCGAAGDVTVDGAVGREGPNLRPPKRPGHGGMRAWPWACGASAGTRVGYAGGEDRGQVAQRAVRSRRGDGRIDGERATAA